MTDLIVAFDMLNVVSVVKPETETRAPTTGAGSNIFVVYVINLVAAVYCAPVTVILLPVITAYGCCAIPPPNFKVPSVISDATDLQPKKLSVSLDV